MALHVARGSRIVGTYAPRIGKLLSRQMKELGFGFDDVATRTGVCYEHIRKLARGLASPSNLLLEELARVLELDPEKLRKLAVRDRLARVRATAERQAVRQ